jgi:hypothetical protein
MRPTLYQRSSRGSRIRQVSSPSRLRERQGNATPSNVRGRNSYMRLLPEEFFPSTRGLPRLAKRPGDVEFTRGLHAVISGFARST